MSYATRTPPWGADDPRAATLLTLDGPAGVGKSSTARAVAAELGWRYLDSGSLYRAVTLGLLRSGVDRESWADLDQTELAALELEIRPGDRSLQILHAGELVPDAELRTEEVTELVSNVAKLPTVREWLWTAQQAAASEGRLVADGRDMGTVVFPHAGTKVFLVADPAERARRRLLDHGVERPAPAELERETARLQARDHQDSTRDVAPLRQPEDARILDTTHLDFEEQVATIVDWARETAESAQSSSD